jgi:methylenetetrahydrofolate dehydrogenase (NADP+)/methenyltetrahydrofolate cyclohydrolase
LTKFLNGGELAGYIKNRQAHEVRALRQARRIFPRLAILTTSTENAPVKVIETYIRLKQRYGADILIDVEVHRAQTAELPDLIKKLNADPATHGMIVQLPIADPDKTDEIVNLVAPEKDVDGLGRNSAFDPATPLAINWLLAGYNTDLKSRRVAIVGEGRLVGRPLARMWKNSGIDVKTLNEKSVDFHLVLRAADVIVTATGVPGLIKSQDVKSGAVVVDAGTAEANGKIVGDLDPAVRARDDLTLTPEKGGVGPLTITALFDNVIRAAQRAAENSRA